MFFASTEFGKKWNKLKIIFSFFSEILSLLPAAVIPLSRAKPCLYVLLLFESLNLPTSFSILLLCDKDYFLCRASCVAFVPFCSFVLLSNPVLFRKLLKLQTHTQVFWVCKIILLEIIEIWETKFDKKNQKCKNGICFENFTWCFDIYSLLQMSMQP